MIQLLGTQHCPFQTQQYSLQNDTLPAHKIAKPLVQIMVRNRCLHVIIYSITHTFD